jgi:8-oxo-dGTP pyrophosphatase MutT (NUDIX family)
MSYSQYALPVSVKGVLFDQEMVWLRRNERNEWELPGGKIDPDEQPAETAERELQEELGMSTRAGRLLQAHVHKIPGSIDEAQGVLVLTYLCELLAVNGNFETTGEAGPARFQQFKLEDVPDLDMPDFYKDAIATAGDVRLA